MRQARVYYNEIPAGIIAETETGRFVFQYNREYVNNPALPAISVTLPKRKQSYSSPVLFPFFFNMLSEGANRKLQCRILKIDEEDYFGLLLKTAARETIGAITVREND